MNKTDLEMFESLAEDILEKMYQPTPVNEILGLEEYLKLPVNDRYKNNKLAQGVDLNSNIISDNSKEDVKSE